MLLASPVFATTTVPEFAKEQAMSTSSLIERWTPLIKEASRKFKIAEDWIKAVMRMESGGRTQLDDGKPITSKKGAMGIMQVMPETYKDMRAQYGLGADPYNPHDNVLAGAAYLRWLYEKYGYPKMFAAYNAGPKTVDAESAGQRDLPDETRAYVSGIAKILGTEFPSLGRVASAPVDPNANFTRPDGVAVLVEAASVSSIRAAMPHEYAPSVQTVIAMGEKRQGVREDLETVTSLLRAHGGKI
jgi:membrane-bound lytic murein transglycosylase B